MTQGEPSRRPARGVTFVSLLAITFVVQVAALVRTLALSAEYGASASLDAFYLASTMAIAVFTIVASGATIVALPHVVLGARIGAWAAFVRRLHRLSLLVSIGLTVVAAAVVIVRVRQGTGAQEFSVFFTLLTLSQQFRVGTAIYNAVLQADGKAVAMKILAALPIVAPAICAVIVPSLLAVCVVTLLSYAAELVGNRLVVGRGAAPVVEMPDVSRLAWAELRPVILSSSVFQAQVIVLTFAAGLFGAGIITKFNNATQLALIPQVLIVQNVLLLAYPWIVGIAQRGQPAPGRRLVGLMGLNVASSYALLLCFVLWGEQITALMFARGNFSAADSARVFDYALILFCSLPFVVIRDLGYRALYALGEASTAASNSVRVVAATLATLALTAPILDDLSVPVSITFGTMVSAGMVMHRLSGTRFSLPLASAGARHLNYAVGFGAAVAVHLAIPSGGLTQQIVADVLAMSALALSMIPSLRADLRSVGR